MYFINQCKCMFYRTGIPPRMKIILCIDCIKMSCNNFLAYYSNYYGYPGTYGGTSYYNRNSCDPCKQQCSCKSKCEPVCQPLCQPCVVACPTNYQLPCSTNYQLPCPTPCPTPVCPAVSFVSTIATGTPIVAGGTPIPAGTIIPAGTTTVPAGTVTVINGFTGSPTTNVGGVIANNGFFTAPIAGRYVIAANVCFASVATVTPTDVRELYIYRVDAITGIVTQLAVDSRTPIAGSPTCVNIATVADLNAGDRIFIAARQTNATSATIETVATTGRFAITRVC